MRASRYLLVTLPFLLDACGGGSASIETADGVHAIAAAVRNDAPPAHCPQGGITVDTGIDSNGNGVLDVAEVAGSQYVCHGAPGRDGVDGANASDGRNALVRMSDEPAGAHCPEGGRKIEAGVDEDADGMLDPAEVTSTVHVCNGAGGRPGTDGTNGTNGTNGLTSIVAIATEPAGSNCAHGGHRVTSGADADANGVLDAGEVNTTSYVCHGTPAGMAWIGVTGDAVQAEPNKGYLARNDVQQVVVTLPANPAEGDIVRVNGVGAAGWRIAQNAGQQILTGKLPGGRLGGSWSAQAGVMVWSALASSASGRTLAAAAFGDAIHVSTDGGLSWTPRGPTANWNALAMSPDAELMIAGTAAGHLHRSADGGRTWTELTGGPAGPWSSLASSADGRHWAAVMLAGQVHVSEDFGMTWSAVGTSSSFEKVTMSADGSKIVAAVPVSSELTVHVLTRSGGAWTERIRHSPSASTGSPVGTLIDIALSADGRKLWAAEYEGYLYSSTDDGASWSVHLPDQPRPWRELALSSDGTRLAAVAVNQPAYLSMDSGTTWQATGRAANWNRLAASADGRGLLASTSGMDSLYTMEPLTATSPGTAGSISGRRYDALELQYLGSGQFDVLSYAGTFDVR